MENLFCTPAEFSTHARRWSGALREISRDIVAETRLIAAACWRVTCNFSPGREVVVSVENGTNNARQNDRFFLFTRDSYLIFPVARNAKFNNVPRDDVYMYVYIHGACK